MRRTTDRPELLDGRLDPQILAGNLKDLRRANRWLGGAALSRRALVALITGHHAGRRQGRRMPRGEPVRLLDVGTGAADIPEALITWLGRRGTPLTVEAIDERDEILDLAFERLGDRADLRLERNRSERLPYPNSSFDVAHTSLVLHHLEPDRAEHLLAEMTRVSRVGVIVNDLDRTRRAWLGAWLVSRLFTRNAYTRHDAPLSVLRAYRPSEVAQLAARVGLVEAGRFRGFVGHRWALAFVPAERPGKGSGPG